MSFHGWRNPLLLLLLCLLGLALIPAARAAGDAPDEILIGAPTTLTSLEGRESLNAVRLAVEEINQAGGVAIGSASAPLKVVAVDLQDALPQVAPEEALARLDRFLTENPVRALVIGPFRSEVLLAAMDLIADRKIPLLGAIAMSSATEDKVLRNPRYKYIFRVGLNADYLVEYLVDNMTLLKDQFGFSRVFILNQDVAWARSTVSMLMKRHLPRLGWQVLGQISLAGLTTDFDSCLKEADQKGAEVILAIFDSAQSGRLVEQWNAGRSPALLTGFISPMCGPGAWETFDRKIAGAVNMIFELGNISSARLPASMEFNRKYRAGFGRAIEAGHGPAPSYEAVHILAEAITRAGGLDPDRLAEALAQTDRQGVMGRVRFHQGGQAVFGSDPAREAVGCLIQWTRDGRRKIVYPPALAEGRIELPAKIRSR